MTLRIAVVSESPKYDGLIVRRIFGHLLGNAASFVDHAYERRVSSRRGVLDHAAQMVRAVYYQTDADVMLVVADLDQDPVPPDGSRIADLTAEGCERGDEPTLWCELAARVRRGLAHRSDRPSSKPLRYVIGVSIPAIEAWLLCPEWTEMKWRQFQNSHPDEGQQRAEKKRMKATAYGAGADRRGRPRMAEVESALASLDGAGIADLPAAFPLGIGQVIEFLRSLAPN